MPLRGQSWALQLGNEAGRSFLLGIRYAFLGDDWYAILLGALPYNGGWLLVRWLGL